MASRAVSLSLLSVSVRHHLKACLPIHLTSPGSNFLVSEAVSDLGGDHAALSICGGNSFAGCNGAILNQSNYGFRELGSGPDPLRVMTTITDNAGDLTGFNEAFAIPEPAAWLLLATGLLSIAALRRRYSQLSR